MLDAKNSQPVDESQDRDSEKPALTEERLRAALVEAGLLNVVRPGSKKRGAIKGRKIGRRMLVENLVDATTASPLDILLSASRTFYRHATRGRGRKSADPEYLELSARLAATAAPYMHAKYLAAQIVDPNAAKPEGAGSGARVILVELPDNKRRVVVDPQGEAKLKAVA